MSNNPQKNEHNYTPEEIRKLAKFFSLLWETQKKLWKDVMEIKDVRIIPVSPNNGLVAFASISVDNGIYLGSIAVYKKLDGGLRLLYPSKKIKGKETTIFHPLNLQTSKVIERLIFDEYKKVILQGCKNDRHNTASLRH